MTRPSSPIAVLHLAEDVRSLLASGVAAASAITLTPSAHAAARASRLPYASSDQRFSDRGYARSVVNVRRALRQLQAAFARETSLNETAKFLLVWKVQMTGYSAARIWHTIGRHGPWVVPRGDGWITTSDRAEAHALVVRQVYDRQDAQARYPYQPPPALGLFRALRNASLRWLRSRGASVLVQRHEHPFGLERLLQKSERPVRQFHVQQSMAGWKEYLRLPREILRSLRGAYQIQAKAVAVAPEKLRGAVTRVLDAVTEPAVRPGLEAAGAGFVDTACIVSAMANDMAEIVSRLRPDLMLSYEVADGWMAALSEGAGKAGVTRVVMNHNSFAPTDSGVADYALGNMMRMMYSPALVDDMVFWTPMGAAAARQYLSLGPQHRIMPVARPGDFDPLKTRERSRRRVLHTGNAMGWFVIWPWTFETTDEYVRGAQELAAAAATVPNAELLIRPKFRGEADSVAMHELLPLNERCMLRELTDRVPFARDLEDADLVTCVYSTTIIQALYHRKPVLLWGGYRRYRHLPARATLPTANDRAAVYTVDDPKNLGPMIAAILDAHAGRPLTDAEIADFTWPTDPPGMRELAQAVAARDHRLAWTESRHAA